VNLLARLVPRMYQALLACYPPDFRNQFGEEMEFVFRTAAGNAAQDGWPYLTEYFWRELKDWPTSVLKEHLQTRRNQMAAHDPFALPKPRELLAALTIFLIPALATLLLEILGVANLDILPEWAGPFLGIIFLGSLIVPLVLAIVRGFPQWSSPYLGVLLVGFAFFGVFWWVWGLIYPSVTRWLGNMYSWTLSVRIFVQGMQAALIWLLVLLSAFILVSVLRLLPHTRAVWERIRQDWTQLSLIIYGGLVIHILLIFDEYQQEELWLIAAWLSLAVGCWLYFHSSEPTQRILILICGATLAMWIVGVGKWVLVPLQNWGPWFERYAPETERWFESLRTLADWFCLVVALVIPAILNLLPQNRQATPQEDPIPA
jgi:hypothetical protein